MRAYSAGSRPAGQVNPGAIAKLQREGLPTEGLESKSWDRFAEEGAPEFDLVLTVCDNAAGEACPVFPGGPLTVHWGIPDPAGQEPLDSAFDEAWERLRRRLEALVALPFESLDRDSMREALTAIHAIAEAREGVDETQPF